MPNRPALIVGVGGTGQQVLYHVKDNLENTYGNVPQNVQLLCFDTTTDSDYPETLADEHKWVGGDALTYGKNVRDAARGLPSGRGYECVAEWHDAPYFTSLADSQGLYNLRIGAGAMRQFGRLAIFYSLSQGSSSTMYRALHTAMSNIRSTGHTDFHAAITGSLVGGTGSGMFADVAYLIGAMANSLNMTSTVRGYFLLPEAFFDTVMANMPLPSKQDAQRKAFAAMREQARFAADFEYQEGIPMYYVCNAIGDPILHGHAQKTLFELLYYFDGSRERNPLTHVNIFQGIAPTIADELVTMVDDTSGFTLTQHAVNVSKYKGDIHGALGRRNVVTAGSIGSYTYVLPVDRMANYWTTNMSEDALQTLLKPVYKTPNDAYASELEPGNGAADVKAWWGGAAISPMLADLGLDIASKAAVGGQNRTSITGDIKNRDLEQWLQKLTPASVTQDLDDAKRNVQAELEKVLHPVQTGGLIKRPNRAAQVLTTEQARDKREKGEPQSAAERVRQDSEKVLADLSGEGGTYARGLQAYAAWHEALFKEQLEKFVRTTMNGQADDTTANALSNRGGKLGYLLAFLTTMQEHFDLARLIISDARETRMSEKGRAHIVNLRSARYDQMRRDHRQQEDYLEVCQQLLEVDRWDLTAKTVEDLTRRMRDFVNRLRDSAQGWARTLAIDPNSMLARVRTAKLRVEAERNEVDQLGRVRKIINDREYEDAQYRRYTNHGQPNDDQVHALLRDFLWTVEQEAEIDSLTRQTIGHHLALRLTLKGGGAGLNPNAALEVLPQTITGANNIVSAALSYAQSNAEALRKRSTRVFDDKKQEESVCKYLMAKSRWAEIQNPDAPDGPNKIADQMFDLAGPLLRHNAPNAVPFNYLVVNFAESDPYQEGFVQAIRAQLAKRANVPINSAPQPIKATDPFRMTLLYHQEVIDIERVTAYEAAKRAYADAAVDRVKDLTLHHVFPAERNAVTYEALIGRGTLLPARVRMLLSNRQRFQVAANCWLYGHRTTDLLHVHQYTQGGNRYSLWVLSIQPLDGETDNRGNPRQTEHYGLTDPGEGEPDLLEAFENFILNGNAKWYWIGADKTIPEDVRDVPRDLPFDLLLTGETSKAGGNGKSPNDGARTERNRIKRRMLEDTNNRVEGEVLGRTASMLTGPLANLKGSDLTTYQGLLAQFEMLSMGEELADSKYSEIVEEIDPAQPRPPQAYLYQLLKAHFIKERENLNKNQIKSYVS
jgi:hypothetical protein